MSERERKYGWELFNKLAKKFDDLTFGQKIDATMGIIASLKVWEAPAFFIAVVDEMKRGFPTCRFRGACSGPPPEDSK